MSGSRDVQYPQFSCSRVAGSLRVATSSTASSILSSRSLALSLSLQPEPKVKCAKQQVAAQERILQFQSLFIRLRKGEERRSQHKASSTLVQTCSSFSLKPTFSAKIPPRTRHNKWPSTSRRWPNEVR